ncbi:MAG: hypothetical protein US66_C0037G0004 [Candidatus Moranbacteria bacterium GW2011_GWD2_37_9]|nr:MAG: hypothetical protein US47_C0001G0300 [Candidatus Moranbacteria bacterium GW2011_GWE1_37_24]KKQ46563.1 MAG: hypothetical protein US66_C0037G0004 [Candidatus Moranbacteria bacterium GW2011_GWD2_37_9]
MPADVEYLQVADSSVETRSDALVVPDANTPEDDPLLVMDGAVVSGVSAIEKLTVKSDELAFSEASWQRT